MILGHLGELSASRVKANLTVAPAAPTEV